jgi:CheY-like chemotaxis protein
VIDKIFEPYFTTKKTGEGTGLGLALVHGIVETYGGEMIVESTPGNGTVFTVYLPIAREQNVPLTYRSDELPTGQESILFVDDEVSIVKIASRILGQLGYSVTIRTSSIDALELFKVNPGAFDLVISDVTMPLMTGDQLAEKILEIRANIPIILCTGFSKKLSEEKALAIGIKAFATKPIVKEDLAIKVRKVLDDAKS